MFIIDDNTNNDVLFPKAFGRGLVERDYSRDPQTMFAPPSALQLIPRSEWSDRIKEKAATKSSINDVRMIADNGTMMVNLNQASSNYCWAHSTTHAVMLSRAMQNLPFIPLSAYAVAGAIMNGANRGGWCGLSAKFAREVGIPSQKLAPQGRFISRLTSEMEADAAQHKVTEDFVDLTQQVYDQNLTFDQLATCLLSGIPCPVDFNWWGHSVCAVELVEPEPGDFGIKILNSWLDWGDNGTGVLRGQKKFPNGALAVRTTIPS